MGMILLPSILMLALSATAIFARVRPEKIIAENFPGTIEYSDFSGKSQPYPVATKRAALLLDRLMVALQKAVENQGSSDSRGERDLIRPKSKVDSSSIESIRPGSSKSGVDLQRRAHANGVYWRCYFNAVTCFKKK